MKQNIPDIIVAGHICLDIIPTFAMSSSDLNSILVPGKLIDVGQAVLATGGTVSNTGIALHRLGVSTGLMGKIGNDLFGQAILDILRGHAPGLADGMIVDNRATTSYSVVLSPPGLDRIFLHCPGANDTYCSDDIAYEKLDGAKLFHFGYPPLMRRMYSDGGVNLAMMLQKVKQKGLTTSLDLAKPDPASDAGKVDWKEILARSLPHVDIFLPSFDELLFMLDRDAHDKMIQGSIEITGKMLGDISERLLQMGPAIIAIKLGDQGLYVRTTPDVKRLARVGLIASSEVDAWCGQELLSPCFEVKVVGTTGSGDCTIAGFLAALVKNKSLKEAATAAVAAGACNVEAADSTSGVPTWPALQNRIAAKWPQRNVKLALPGWKQNHDAGLWIGPNDHVCPNLKR